MFNKNVQSFYSYECEKLSIYETIVFKLAEIICLLSFANLTGPSKYAFFTNKIIFGFDYTNCAAADPTSFIVRTRIKGPKLFKFKLYIETNKYIIIEISKVQYPYSVPYQQGL